MLIYLFTRVDSPFPSKPLGLVSQALVIVRQKKSNRRLGATYAGETGPNLLSTSLSFKLLTPNSGSHFDPFPATFMKE